MVDFLQSRTFITHLTGLLAALGSGAALPNAPWVSVAIALITGVTQACHAYSSVKTQPSISADQVATIFNAAVAATAPTQAPAETAPPHINGPLA